MEPLRRTHSSVAVRLPASLRAALVAGAGRLSSDPDYVAGLTRAVEFVARRHGCSAEDAVDLMLDRSVAEGTSLGEVALGVVEGRVRFDA